MSAHRRWSALVILAALLVVGCTGGKPYVLVAAKEPKYSEDPEWLQAHERAGRASTRDWRSRYNQYSQCLVARATQLGLDSASLSNVLQVILADAPRKRRAYVPFAAYKSEVEHKPVWVVHLAWEYEGAKTPLGHHCSYTINPQDRSNLGFVTCM